MVFTFQKQFHSKVQRGLKTNTIRATRRGKVGDAVSLRKWTGAPYRSKQAVLREAILKEILSVQITPFDVFLDGKRFSGQHLAVMDGFKDWEGMRDWFDNVHGLPFNGWFYRWELQ